MAQQYRFKATDWQGNKSRGRLTALNKAEALEQLRSRHLVPIDLTEHRFPNLLKPLHKIGLRQYNSRDLMIFCRQLSTMLTAGIAVLRALHILSGQMEKRIFQEKLRSASFSLEQGSGLAEALRREKDFFPPLLVNMVEAGEESGNLEAVMERMADHYENQHDLEEKIRSATAYPIFITAVACIVVLVMIVFVLPQFAAIFNSMGLEMPLPSRLLLNLGEFAAGNWYIILALLLIIVVNLAWYAKTVKGRLKIDRLRLRLPLYGKIYSQTIAARFSRTLSTLLASGVTLHSALVLIDKIIDNRVLSRSINDLSGGLSRGESMAVTMGADKNFPPLLAEMVRVGEETGSLDETLNSTAAFYEKEVAYVVERLSTILEPVLLLAVGLFIGLLVFSILSPMYQVFQMI
ncbi:MAG: type II secretion system F family protein [Bacillota bacterium]